MLSGRLICPQLVGSIVTPAGTAIGGHTAGQLVPLGVTSDGTQVD
jgi:hypothetical protein